MTFKSALYVTFVAAHIIVTDAPAQKPGVAGNKSPRVRIVAADTLLVGIGDAILIREPGKDDELFVRTRAVSAKSIHVALRRLEVLWLLQGDSAREAGMFHIDLAEESQNLQGREAQLGRTARGRQRLIDEKQHAAQIAHALTAPNPQGARYARGGVGEGRYITARITRMDRLIIKEKKQ